MAHDLFYVRNLADVRSDADLTQHQLATSSNVAVKTISEIENDQSKKVRQRTAKRIQTGLGAYGSKLQVVRAS
jgi:transcriptional regulator with XRE-family HTH domain